MNGKYACRRLSWLIGPVCACHICQYVVACCFVLLFIHVCGCWRVDIQRQTRKWGNGTFYSPYSSNMAVLSVPVFLTAAPVFLGVDRHTHTRGLACWLVDLSTCILIGARCYRDALYSNSSHALGCLPLPNLNVALNNAHGIFQY